MDTAASRTGTGDRLQDAAGGLLDQAGRTAESQASWTMTKAGDTLDEVARAVRDAGSGLRQDRPEIAGFADTAAERVEEAARYLRVHDASDLIDEATRFARQQPVVVVGGFLLAGLALGRLLKSGSTASRYGYGTSGDYTGTGYRSGYGTGYGTGYDTTYRGSNAYAGTSRTATEYGREATMASSSGATPRSTTTRSSATRTTRSTAGDTQGSTSTKSTTRSTRANTSSTER